MSTSNLTADLPLPHDDYDAGFRVGWEAVTGATMPLPQLLPTPPRLFVVGQSKFTMGVRAGVEGAMGIDDLDELQLRPS